MKVSTGLTGTGPIESLDQIIISAPYAGLGLDNYGKLYIIGAERRSGGIPSFLLQV